MGRQSHTAVTQTFGPAALVQRCQVHKRRNVERGPAPVGEGDPAYTHADVKAARRLLQDLAADWTPSTRVRPRACRRPRRDTHRHWVTVSERLQRSLATTNAIESLLSRTRHIKRILVLRWVAAGVLEAAKGFGA